MKAAVHLVFAVFFCSVAITAEATAQFTDLIMIEGKSEQLFTEPLEQALRVNKSLKYKLGLRIPEQTCSASWRGYVAKWEIRKNEVYLVEVQVDPCSEIKKIVPLAELFSGAAGPVKAKWFSGTLMIPQGDQIEYVHMGYESRYERYLFLDIKNGKVIDSTITSGSFRPGLPAPSR